MNERWQRVLWIFGGAAVSTTAEGEVTPEVCDAAARLAGIAEIVESGSYPPAAATAAVQVDTESADPALGSWRLA
jgi:hypothetical protein